MRAIIADVRRGCRIVSCLLAAFAAFAAAQTAQAATKKGWMGSGDRYWTTSGNWKDISANADGYFLRSGEGTTLDATKRTILFNQSTSISIKISVESAGTSASVPYVFLADSDSYGLTTSGNFDVGTWKAGHLAIQRGTFKCNQLNVGGGDATSGDVLVIGGSGNNATVTATGKVSINKETVQVKGDGKLICQSWAAAGNTDNNTGTLVIDGGEVQHSTANYLTIGDTEKATGYVYVKNGGKYSNTGSHSNGLCVGQKNVGTLDVDNGTVDLGTKKLMLCDNTNGKATVNVKNGAVVTMGCVAYGTGTGGATMTIDGGTVKAGADNSDFMPALANLDVYVGENGATFDTDGHIITIGENLKDVSGKTGSVRFVGGGIATLSAAGEYTGVTTVEVGTTLHVPSPAGVGGGFAVSVPAETPATGTYSLLVCDGEGAFTAAVLDGVAAPAGATLSLSRDGKVVLCTYGDGGPVWIGGTSGSLSDAANWGNNAVPGAGTNCVIGVSGAATLTVGDSFAASSITFPADSAAVTINAAAGESITGIVAITNLSLTTSHTNNVPVHFAGNIQVKQAADHYDHRTLPHVTFAGGAYAGAGGSIETGSTVNWSRCIFGEYSLGNTEDSRLTAPVYSNCRPAVTDNSTLYVPFAGRLTELYVGVGAKVFIGDMALDGRLLYQNYGEVVVTNMTVTGSSDVFVSHNQGTTTPGVFKFESVTNSLSSKWFYLSDYNAASKNVFYIGAGGLNFTSDTASYCLGNQKGTDNLDTIRPWYSDFTIADGGNEYNVAFDYGATFCTDDEGGIGRTITIASGTRAAYASPVVVSGSGTLKVNKPCQNAVQPQVVVTDTATLEYAAGASLGTGPLTLGTGTTFVVASADLPIPVASLTLPESGKATIQISGNALADDDYEVLFVTAGLPAGFADKINIVLPDGTSENRRLYTTDNGTMRLIVGSGDVPDPYTWTGAANDGKMNTAGNWRGGVVPPTGATVFIQSTGGAIVNDIENFAPAFITFGYGTDTVTISGNAITGVAAITNLSTTASHTINAPVAFADKILVVQGAMSWEQRSNPSIHFAGGVTGTTFADGTARYLKGAFYLSTGADWVANTQGSNTRWGLPAGSSLTLPSATDTCELALGDSSTSGGAFTTGVMRTSARLLCWNYGEYVVTNEFTATFPANAVHYCGYENISNGKFKFEKVTLDGAYNSPFKFGNERNASDLGTQRFLIGNGGLCFADGASQNLRYETGGMKNDSTVRVDPWHGDYTIHTKSASNPTDFTVTAKTYFGTTDEGGNACTVTDEGVINSYGSAADINIDGNGKFVVNAVCAATCPVTVTNTATLAINAGKKLTTGATAVNDGATLEVAESGTVAFGGALTLKAGAALGFNYTNRNEPVLDLTDKAVTFDEGAATNVVVKISADAGKRAKVGANVLTSGGKFADATVSLAPGAPDWVNGISVVDGEIVLDAKPMGTILIVR